MHTWCAILLVGVCFLPFVVAMYFNYRQDERLRLLGQDDISRRKEEDRMNKIRLLAVIAVLTLAALAASTATSFADGSDPMPLCRGKNCPPVIPPAS